MSAVRNCIAARRLDSQQIQASENPEIAILAPRGAPIVSDDPVGSFILTSPTNDIHVLIVQRGARVPRENPISVVKQIVSNRYLARDRTVEIDLVHHGTYATDRVIGGNIVFLVG